LNWYQRFRKQNGFHHYRIRSTDKGCFEKIELFAESIINKTVIAAKE